MLDYSIIKRNKSHDVRLLNKEETKYLLEKYHYLGFTKFYKYSIGHDGGCLLFGCLRSRKYNYNDIKKGINSVELVRMCAVDDRDWSLTSLMSKSIKLLKKIDNYDKIITYADPYYNHTGRIYKAFGFINDGYIVKDGHPIFIIDGKQISPRSLYYKHGTSSKFQMKEIYGNRLVMENKEPKLRFIFYLTKKGKLLDNKENI